MIQQYEFFKVDGENSRELYDCNKLRLFFFLYTETVSFDEKVYFLFHQMTDDVVDLLAVDRAPEQISRVKNGNAETVVETLTTLSARFTTEILKDVSTRFILLT